MGFKVFSVLQDWFPCHTCFALTTLFAVVAVLLPGVDVDFRRAPDALVVVDIRVEDIFRFKFYKKVFLWKNLYFSMKYTFVVLSPPFVTVARLKK